MKNAFVKCAKLIHVIARMGNGTASIWYLFQPKRPKL